MTTSQPASNPPVPPQRDYRQEVTDNIVRLLENGVAPWQKPWSLGESVGGMPMNPTTGKAYRGGNAIHLLATGLRRDYDDPRWMTYKQAAEQGWQVRKGEKGTQIEFWDVKAPEAGKPQPNRPATGDGNAEGTRKEDQEGPRLIHRVYTVFNAKQIEGVPSHTPKVTTPFEAVQAGEHILASSGAKIKHDQADRAFYSRTQDSIHLPPKAAFQEAPGYYGTALHELAHWTGHPSRLNRATLNEAYRFGDAQYAKEELRAELASIFLAAERGIPHDPYQHAAYVGHWIKALKEDKHEIFRAAHDASAATEYLLTLERDPSLSNQPDATKRVFPSGVNGQTVISTTNASEASQGVPRQETRSAHKTDPAANSAETVRETHQPVTRLERSSGTVNVHDKQTATDQRSTLDTSLVKGTRTPDVQVPPTAEHALNGVHAMATSLLGASARVYRAQTESGIYRGPIIAVADGHVVQRLSAQSAVAPPKSLLDKHPAVGENVAVTYSASKGAVRELQERVKSPHRGR